MTKAKGLELTVMTRDVAAPDGMKALCKKGGIKRDKKKEKR